MGSVDQSGPRGAVVGPRRVHDDESRDERVRRRRLVAHHARPRRHRLSKPRRLRGRRATAAHLVSTRRGLGDDTRAMRGRLDIRRLRQRDAPHHADALSVSAGARSRVESVRRSRSRRRDARAARRALTHSGGDSMIRLIRSLGAVVLLLAGRAGVCRAQGEAAQNPNDSASRFSRMMPLARYLITDRATEIAVAKSAAPAAISDHADVWILGRHGYEIAVRGTNGFACMVERAWTSDFDDPDFMNPTAREPTCLNAAAARTVLPRIVVKTRLAFAGIPKEQMVDSIRAAYARHELPLPARGAMSYMMSKETYFGPYYGHGGPHLMFYFPRTDSL